LGARDKAAVLTPRGLKIGSGTGGTKIGSGTGGTKITAVCRMFLPTCTLKTSMLKRAWTKTAKALVKLAEKTFRHE
jgi:hypothetical protein